MVQNLALASATTAYLSTRAEGGGVWWQLSPSAMADPDWDGDDDTVDFSSMASLGTLFRQARSNPASYFI
jgi:hypothetical protein